MKLRLRFLFLILSVSLASCGGTGAGAAIPAIACAVSDNCDDDDSGNGITLEAGDLSLFEGFYAVDVGDEEDVDLSVELDITAKSKDGAALTVSFVDLMSLTSNLENLEPRRKQNLFHSVSLKIRMMLMKTMSMRLTSRQAMAPPTLSPLSWPSRMHSRSSRRRPNELVDVAEPEHRGMMMEEITRSLALTTKGNFSATEAASPGDRLVSEGGFDSISLNELERLVLVSEAPDGYNSTELHITPITTVLSSTENSDQTMLLERLGINSTPDDIFGQDIWELATIDGDDDAMGGPEPDI